MAWISLVVISVLLGTGQVHSTRVTTLYDVLDLVYQLCATEEFLRDQRLECLDYYLRSKVTSVMQNCLSSGTDVRGSLNTFCSRLTNVSQWSSKYKYPPRHLTRVISLAAFGKMACVLREAKLPFLNWQKAFQKCFPIQEKIKKKYRPKPRTPSVKA